jgi:sugar O-acyltransferase (sialic acid O-acetyltransferase NeuD family)
MMVGSIVIVGAGGHAAVVVDALLSAGMKAHEIKLADTDSNLWQKLVLGCEVAGPKLLIRGSRVHIAVGDNSRRLQLYNELVAIGCSGINVLHPRSSVSGSATISEGVFIAAGGIVGPRASIGNAAIINHGAVVDHDCVVGMSAHIGPNSTLGGNVRVGCRVLLGSGSNVLPGIHIGDDATVGAGAVVVENVPAGVTVVGVPARRVSPPA